MKKNKIIIVLTAIIILLILIALAAVILLGKLYKQPFEGNWRGIAYSEDGASEPVEVSIYQQSSRLGHMIVSTKGTRSNIAGLYTCMFDGDVITGTLDKVEIIGEISNNKRVVKLEIEFSLKSSDGSDRSLAIVHLEKEANGNDLFASDNQSEKPDALVNDDNNAYMLNMLGADIKDSRITNMYMLVQDQGTDEYINSDVLPYPIITPNSYTNFGIMVEFKDIEDTDTIDFIWYNAQTNTELFREEGYPSEGTCGWAAEESSEENLSLIKEGFYRVDIVLRSDKVLLGSYFIQVGEASGDVSHETMRYLTAEGTHAVYSQKSSMQGESSFIVDSFIDPKYPQFDRIFYYHGEGIENPYFRAFVAEKDGIYYKTTYDPTWYLYFPSKLEVGAKWQTDDQDTTLISKNIPVQTPFGNYQDCYISRYTLPEFAMPYELTFAPEEGLIRSIIISDDPGFTYEMNLTEFRQTTEEEKQNIMEIWNNAPEDFK